MKKARLQSAWVPEWLCRAEVRLTWNIHSWLNVKKTRESPLDSKIKPVSPKGNQSGIFIGRTDAEAPILWSPDVKSRLTGKDPDAGKDWGHEEKGTTEDEMVGWHHRLNGHEFEQTPRDGEGQGSLACCSPCGCRVRHDWTTRTISQLSEWPSLKSLQITNAGESIEKRFSSYTVMGM